MMRLFPALLVLLPLGALVAAQGDKALSESLGHFTMRFYRHLALNPDLKNFVFSPLSLHTALSYLYLGATPNSDTYSELQTSLGQLTDKTRLKKDYSDIGETYRAGGSPLRFGNRMWLKNDIDIHREFNNDMRTSLNADMKNINFADPQARHIINKWVSNMTANKIQDFVKSLDPETKVYLTNALYFYDSWLIPFNDRPDPASELSTGDVRMDYFSALDARQSVRRKVVPTMKVESFDGELRYGRIKTRDNRRPVEVVTIPYANRNFEMRIILPSNSPRNAMRILENEMIENSGRWSWEEGDDSFNPFRLDEDRVSGNDLNLTLVMPTFKIASDVDVADILRKLNIQQIFNEAELSEMTDSSLTVSDISHKAVVEVIKEGTSGAAATGIGLTLLSADEPRRVTLNINRPFIFMVHDVKNDIPILVGRVLDPTDAI